MNRKAFDVKGADGAKIGTISLREEKSDRPEVWAAVAKCKNAHSCGVCGRQRALAKGSTLRFLTKWLLDGSKPRPEPASSSTTKKKPGVTEWTASTHQAHDPEDFENFELPEGAGWLLENDMYDLLPLNPSDAKKQKRPRDGAAAAAGSQEKRGRKGGAAAAAKPSGKEFRWFQLVLHRAKTVLKNNFDLLKYNTDRSPTTPPGSSALPFRRQHNF